MRLFSNWNQAREARHQKVEEFNQKKIAKAEAKKKRLEAKKAKAEAKKEKKDQKTEANLTTTRDVQVEEREPVETAEQIAKTAENTEIKQEDTAEIKKEDDTPQKRQGRFRKAKEPRQKKPAKEKKTADKKQKPADPPEDKRSEEIPKEDKEDPGKRDDRGPSEFYSVPSADSHKSDLLNDASQTPAPQDLQPPKPPASDDRNYGGEKFLNVMSEDTHISTIASPQGAHLGARDQPVMDEDRDPPAQTCFLCGCI